MTEALVRCAECEREWIEERLGFELFGATCYECGSTEVDEVRE